MGGLKNRHRLLIRNGSATSVPASSSISQSDGALPAARLGRSLRVLPRRARETRQRISLLIANPAKVSQRAPDTIAAHRVEAQAEQSQPNSDIDHLRVGSPDLPKQPLVTVEKPTPETSPGPRRGVDSIVEEHLVGEQERPLSPGHDRRRTLTLLDPERRPLSPSSEQGYSSVAPPTNIAMQICEDGLVDDVRDVILKRYANSLGRSLDSPDVMLRMLSRLEHQRTTERTLGPEEEMCRTLDAYFPGGQTVDEALLIDVLQRRSTFKPSPRAANHTSYHNLDDYRPVENGTGSSASDSKHINGVPPAPPMPTPPAPEAAPTKSKGASTPPPSRVSSPRPTSRTRSGSRRQQPLSRPSDDGPSNPSLPSSLLGGSVPPINVLIVEDNVINLKLLEAFMERLKVRWQTAMNGQVVVRNWREGGFHLVLMDIQLPIMSGLEATKEIRRLERVNELGLFNNVSSAAVATTEKKGELGEEGKLQENAGLFKSPVIIVALTASSLQSDRHEVLAVGCNDFLTKPVSFVWLERKVKEWGCMQALIDFDGWRKWKDFAAQNGQPDNKPTAKGKEQNKTIKDGGVRASLAGKKEGTRIGGGEVANA
ncbi:hypothetical protein B0A49_07419 [Cryomyces minteri]|uniref:Response regulatory domain-containing protein n=1 Tax=Cryomyces minteri TaxID=331657 RepID=A0A4U0WR58_9PEZI|nr:hypothetical protein B0A49_07419 [Cryomyces minteri]